MFSWKWNHFSICQKRNLMPHFSTMTVMFVYLFEIEAIFGPNLPSKTFLKILNLRGISNRWIDTDIQFLSWTISLDFRVKETRVCFLYRILFVLCWFVLMILEKYACCLGSIGFTVMFTDKSHRNFREHKQQINEGPRSLFEEKCRIWPSMAGCWLDDNWVSGQMFLDLFVPPFKGQDILRADIRDCAIFIKIKPNYLRYSFR